MSLVGLVGKPQAGKSEVRNVLITQHHFTSINTKLPLIRACQELVYLENNEKWDDKEEHYKGVPIRKIMGKVQDSVEALFGDYHTIENALVDYPMSVNRNYVLDALRKTQPDKFPGFIVEVISDRELDTGNPFDWYSRNRIDFQIYNNGNLEELERSVDAMIVALGIRT